LAQPRADDPPDGVAVPLAHGHHPNADRPSKIDCIHAAKVVALPLRNEKGQ
jgi:phospholipase C